ncbi:MAG: tRNA pseudouridine(38-40) synthase TruA [Vicinamibacterales bacterium]
METEGPFTYRLTLAYDGSGFVGWQRQPEGTSVQGLLEGALRRLQGEPVPVVGAGRTDAGVHALGQVASFVLMKPIDPVTLRRALNALLPRSVRVLSATVAEPGFNARFDTLFKTYQYALATGPLVGPFESEYLWHLRRRLDTAAMAEAAVSLEGRHDFAAFCSTGSGAVTTTRTVLRSRFRPARTGEPGWVAPPATAGAADCERWLYEITGDGFLRHMVRAIVGFLVEVGRGRLEPSDLPSLLASRDRSRAGATAPARGLCLVTVVTGKKA